MRFASSALFAGAVSRRDLEIILAYLRARLARAIQGASFSGAHCVAIEREIAIIETALAGLALPITHAGSNDNGLLPEGR